MTLEDVPVWLFYRCARGTVMVNVDSFGTVATGIDSRSAQYTMNAAFMVFARCLRIALQNPTQELTR
jgi:hypothetical protein